MYYVCRNKCLPPRARRRISKSCHRWLLHVPRTSRVNWYLQACCRCPGCPIPANEMLVCSRLLIETSRRRVLRTLTLAASSAQQVYTPEHQAPKDWLLSPLSLRTMVTRKSTRKAAGKAASALDGDVAGQVLSLRLLSLLHQYKDVTDLDRWHYGFTMITV